MNFKSFWGNFISSGFKSLGSSQGWNLLKSNFHSEMNKQTNKNQVCRKLTLISHTTNRGTRQVGAR